MDAVERTCALIVAKLARDYPEGGALRCQHAKGFAVEGELKIEQVPELVRHGVFAIPQTYPVVIRFSSSNPHPQSDEKPDARGCAIKVQGIVDDDDGGFRTWDIVTATGRAFFAKTQEDCEELAGAMADDKMPSYFFPRRLWEFGNVWIATHYGIRDPLAGVYDSQTPFALGPHTIRYIVKGSSAGIETTGPDRLREAVETRLATAPATLDLYVQIASNDWQAEDARWPWVRWPKPTLVGTITLPMQTVQDGEELSFNPGNAPYEHRPVGSINQLREDAYDASAGFRRAR